MALRREDLYQGGEAQILAFPTRHARARAARARQLERRRRSAGIAVVVAAIAGLWALPGAPAGGGGAGDIPESVRLQRGDTLWDLAEVYAPSGSDPRAFIAEIRELNELEGVPFPGQRLHLPN